MFRLLWDSKVRTKIHPNTSKMHTTVGWMFCVYFLMCLLCMHMSARVCVLVHAGPMRGYGCECGGLTDLCWMSSLSFSGLFFEIGCFTEPGTHWVWPANSSRNLPVLEPQCWAYKCRPLCRCFSMDAGYQHLGPHVSSFAHEVNVKWLSIKYMPPISNIPHCFVPIFPMQSSWWTLLILGF